MKETKVVHVNSAEFRQNPEAVYIGRAVPRAAEPRCRVASMWANPYRVVPGVRTAEYAVLEYGTLLRTLIADDPANRAALLDLRGKTLGCWCKHKGHEPCHGDAIVNVIEELVRGEGQAKP